MVHARMPLPWFQVPSEAIGMRRAVSSGGSASTSSRGRPMRAPHLNKEQRPQFAMSRTVDRNAPLGRATQSSAFTSRPLFQS